MPGAKVVRLAVLVPISTLLCTLNLGNVQGSFPEKQLSSQAVPIMPTHALSGKFLGYWEKHGGLSQLGYPISGEIQEVSETNGKTYTMQYFERARLELHPENQTLNDVQASLLGAFAYQEKYPNGASGQSPSTDPKSVVFPETGKHLGGKFLAYWNLHGGLPQQGYPISDEFLEKSQLDGKVYKAQYFERAVFEYHPENKGTQYEVLLSQLGTLRYREESSGSQQAPTDLAIPAPPVGSRQLAPSGSNDYLVWVQSSKTVDGASHIMGLNLKTNQPLTITDTPCKQDIPAVSGSLVVWQTISGGIPCNYGDRDVIGKDLSRGTTYDIAVDPARDQSAPAIANKSVAWIEGDSSSIRVMSKEVDNNKVMVVRTFPIGANQSVTTTLSPPLISGEYIVWAEAGLSDQATRSIPIQILAYNRKLATTSKVGEYEVPIGGGPLYALDGHQVAWCDERQQVLRVMDLTKGETVVLDTQQVQSVIVHGNLIIWSEMSAGSGTNGADIYGANLKDRTVIPLVTGVGDQLGPTVAGDWLVWSNVGGSYDGRLMSKKLADVFSTHFQP